MFMLTGAQLINQMKLMPHSSNFISVHFGNELKFNLWISGLVDLVWFNCASKFYSITDSSAPFDLVDWIELTSVYELNFGNQSPTINKSNWELIESELRLKWQAI